MGQTAKRHATYEDILNLPENLVGEIIGGALYTQPRPAPKHAVAHSVLGFSIGGPFHGGTGGPGGWWIIDEPELHIGGDILVPDLAGWRRERMPALPETAWFELPPDWVCEVLSPSTARIDRSLKMPRYARWGVPYLWMVDPSLRTLEVYALEQGRWCVLTTLKDDDPVRQPPFEAVEFPLDRLWA
ncbi:hypothetical protein MIN45_P1395 [Methylomarinovum tepidoasis]|uniref:Putative restriction endonuclease domain-containing protein n=1 Tax=Methylomarinovum tepidoasis TaxID=2840183 RepID=A0AAU9C9C1_9GAMM|nr:Uma2 family endonuclease [Methylomarinovum sp. IN45]BCX89025.1 hypothetical protein MIN45_P1395 [Methylomarinovum sp. IN45]